MKNKKIIADLNSALEIEDHQSIGDMMSEMNIKSIVIEVDDDGCLIITSINFEQ